MAGVNDHKIFSMLRIRPVSIGRDDASYPPMIKGEGPEMFGDENNGVPLAFVGTEGSRRENFPAFKAE
jgi:hypothetical protein